MEITILDFCLINLLSYLAGLGTGMVVCCKNKDKFFVKSRSTDDTSTLQTVPQPSTVPYSTPPIMASAPPSETKHPVKITLE